MRFRIILALLCATILSCALLSAQPKNITLKADNQALSEVLSMLESQEGYYFLYKDKSLNLKRKVSIDVSNVSIEVVLNQILDSSTGYEISARQIVLYRKASPKTTPPSSIKDKLSGVVKDAAGQVLVGVTVIEDGTRNGVTTDSKGRYYIEIDDSQTAILSFSCLGYATEYVAVAGLGSLDVVLSEEFDQLDDVVVIAYGTQTKASITGALSTIDTEELVKAPVASITNVLAGAAPGVSTVQTTGEPGKDAAKIYIRGAGSLTDADSTPLVLVDGVERDFSQIDPNEIENFSILKDAASTAVFGVRGANGVILITTKRGQEGRPSITISSTTGVQQPMSYVKRVGSYEHARFWNMKQQNDGITDPSKYFTEQAIEAYRTGSDPILYPSKNWPDELFNKFFLQTKNNISISGGGKNIRYFVSLGYLYQNGIIKQSPHLDYNNNYKYDRYNYRANLDFDITSSTTFKIGVGGTIGESQAPRFIGVNAGEGNQWVFAYIWATPFAGPGIVDGTRTLVSPKFLPSGVEMKDGYNAFYGHGYDQQFTSTLNMDVELNQKLDFITEGLEASIKGAFDNRFAFSKMRPRWDGVEYQTVYYKSYLDDPTKPMSDPDYDYTHVFVPSKAARPIGYGEQGYSRDRNWYLEGKIHYSRTFGAGSDHKVSAMLLYNQSRDYYTSAGSGSYAYIPRSYVGYVGRVTYSFRGKYLMDVNMGYNGSENFAPGKTRYGAFPSASVGWVVSEEKFMKQQNVISYMKLRASRGIVGNDRSSSRFIYVPGVWGASGNYSFGLDNPNGLEAYAHGTPGNSAVSWETATKQNYGVDINFFKGRLTTNFDYFTEHRTGILMKPKSYPGVLATTLPEMNIGIVDNSGYEISLGWKDTTKSGFNYYINTNLSYAHNQIVYMDEVLSQYDYQNQTGGSTGRYTGIYEFIRLYNEDDFIVNSEGKTVLKEGLPIPNADVSVGDAMYADLNGDNVVDSNDTKVAGFPMRPEYVLGINAGFNYKGFNFSMQWAGAANVNRMFEIEYRIPFTNAGGRGLLDYLYNDCWTPENPNGIYPRAAEKTEAWNAENSTLWLFDSKYLRLKNLTIGYTFSNQPWLKRAGIKGLGLSLSGYNLLTITPLKYMDPESNTNNNGSYPLVKVYSFGFNLQF